MYKLLIVDDEYQARCGLRDLIDWRAMGVCVCGDADDGECALPLIETLRPDILLTDVRMNHMDGLALAREARKILPNLEIIFISGYSDSEYLHQALRVDALEYLYKPVRVAELENLIRGLVARLDKSREATRQIERMREVLEKSRPFVLERLLHSWIRGNIEDLETIKNRLDLLDLSIPALGGFSVVIFQPEWTDFPLDGKAEAYLMLLESAVKECLNSDFVCVDETEVVTIVPLRGEKGKESFQEAFTGVSDKMRGVADARLLIGVGAWHSDWTEVPIAVREARLTLERRISHSEETPFFFDDMQAVKELPDDKLDDRFNSFMERYLLIGQFDELWAGIEESLNLPQDDNDSRDISRVRKMLMSWALRADLLMAHKKLEGIDSLSFCRKAMGHWPVASAKAALKAALRDACARISDLQENAYSPCVSSVLEIISTKYDQRLNIEFLAEQVHYSAAHLSALFRQETGMTIGDALFSTRLSAAMEMLSATTETVSVVARKSGYTDVQYFSRVFKRFTGITPLQYRKKCLSC